MEEKIEVTIRNEEEARARQALAKILDFLAAAPVTGAAVYDPPDVEDYGGDDYTEYHYEITLEGDRTLEGVLLGADRWYAVRLQSADGRWETVYVHRDVWASLEALAEEICQRLEDTYYNTLAKEWAGVKIEIVPRAGDE